MTITNLQRLGVNTELENKVTLNLKGDVRQDFMSVFRVLKRLTLGHTFGQSEVEDVIRAIKTWKPGIQLADQYTLLSPEDLQRVSGIIGFNNRDITPITTLTSGHTIVCLYDGAPFRGSHIFAGSLNTSAPLPSGRKLKDVFLISRQAAVLLNWAQMTYGVEPERSPSWSSVYRDQGDTSYFGVLAHFITSKFARGNAIHHRQPLTKIFTDFYTDYLSTFSVTLQTREQGRLNHDSVATAYETKKNIPDYIQARMETSDLNRIFDFVEFDADIDTTLIPHFEGYVRQLRTLESNLFSRNVSALRLRKLGKHSSINKTTTGLYYPHIDNLVIDIKDVRSFTHEWGHALDNKHGTLSNQFEFVSGIYPAIASRIIQDVNIAPDMKAYYLMPTEVFARMFEWYIHDKHDLTHNGALQDRDTYRSATIYTAYESVRDTVYQYFEQLMI